MKAKTLLVYFCLFVGSFMNLNATEEKTKVIIDTDCDMDDMMAILYLLKKPKIDVIAVTTTGTGIAHWRYTAQNALDLLELAGHPKIPVSYGAEDSLSPYANFPEKWRTGVDEVFKIPLPKNPNPPSSFSSWELIVRKIKESKEKVTLLALGPLTNVAIALEKAPEIVKNIEKIVISGGAVYTEGNIEGKPHNFVNKCAEYNIFLDVAAAKKVFSADVSIVLVPLDATEQVPITQKIAKRFGKEKNNPSAQFIYEVIDPYLKSQLETKVYFWDPAAATVLTNPKIGSYKELNLTINDTPGPEYGCIMVDKSGHPISVCLSIDAELFYHLFYGAISHEE